MLTAYSFLLPGLNCNVCVERVVTKLADLKKSKKILIDTFQVNLFPEKKATIIVQDDDVSSVEVEQMLLQVLDGYDPKRQEHEDPVLSLVPPLKKKSYSHWFLGFLGMGAGFLLQVLPLFLGALPLGFMIPIALTSIILTLTLGAESFKEAYKKLSKSRELTMDTLFAISTLTVMTVSIAAFFVPWLPMMFDVSLLIFGFRHVGQAIEESIKRSLSLETRFTDRLPKNVDRVLPDGSCVSTLLNDIKPNDFLLVAPGEIIPVDGICEIEQGSIFETIITGSPLPRQVAKGELLQAGMYLAKDSQPLRIKVTAAGRQSYLARLNRSVAQASDEKSPLETVTTTILQYFIPAVIVMAIVSALIVGYFFTIPLAIQCAVSVLVSACPCTLGFITPLAVKIGWDKAADAYGVLFKSSKTMQDAAVVDAVVFDLNGTLTKGVPSVTGYGIHRGVTLSRDALLGYFAVLEKHSSHPIAKAICAFAVDHKVCLPNLELTDLDTTDHSGISACLNGVKYLLGNQTMMDEACIDTQDLQDSIRPEDGDTIVYLARAGDKNPLGHIKLSDPLREHARYVVDSLKSLGLQTHLCTGADVATAVRFAHKLGISPLHVRAGCRGAPGESTVCDKKIYIDQLKQQGHRVAMVGDAGNDTLAITASDFGIAIKSSGGDEMTQQQAGAVVQSGSLLPVVSVFAVAKQTVSHIKQGLLFSLGYNLGAMMIAGGLLLTIGVTLNPSVGVVLMILQTSLILLNALRFKHQKLAHIEQLHTQEEYSPCSYRRLAASMPTLHTCPQFEKGLNDKVKIEPTLAKPVNDGWENSHANGISDSQSQKHYQHF